MGEEWGEPGSWSKHVIIGLFFLFLWFLLSVFLPISALMFGHIDISIKTAADFFLFGFIPLLLCVVSFYASREYIVPREEYPLKKNWFPAIILMLLLGTALLLIFYSPLEAKYAVFIRNSGIVLVIFGLFSIFLYHYAKMISKKL